MLMSIHKVNAKVCLGFYASDQIDMELPNGK